MNKKNSILFLVGIACVAACYLPMFLLGGDAIFTYHDQLDGEMIAYILQAKHMGEGNYLPEFLGGASKTALMPPAFLCVLLFRVFSPLFCLQFMQIAGVMIGFVGMFFLVKYLTDCSEAGVVSGILYGMLPFLPVYGLSQYGLPLLFYFALRLREKNYSKQVLIGAWLYAAFYAGTSSLVLVGFAVVAVLLAGMLLPKSRNWKMAGFAAIIIGVYGICNLTLIGQVLGITESAISHKTEYALVPEHFLESVAESFLQGGQHSVDYHLWILVLVISVLVYGAFRKNIVWKQLGNCLFLNLLFALIAGLWNCQIGVAIRENFGALGAFQMDRFLWIAPCIWYAGLGICIAYILELLRQKKKISGIVFAVFLVAVLPVTGIEILKNSDVKSNIQKLRNPDYGLLSYNEYYGVGVLEQVEEFLRDTTGESQDQYRIVSLGIDPAAALYHGFYCLDGYSNNYDLKYKHDFRRVLAPALQESAYLSAYFDDWGNRCYLFGTEAPGYYTIAKTGFYFQHLELDTKALADLGADYLFSAAYIANAGELGLELLQENPFETKESYYRIYVYEVAHE